MTITATNPKVLPETPAGPVHTGHDYSRFEPLTPEERGFLDRLFTIRADINLPEQFRVLIERDKKNPAGRFYFQIDADRIDTFTGKLGTGRGGKAYLSDSATESELVQTIFGLYDAYCHHEVRETFLWCGRRVFGPHVSIRAHWEVAETYDARPQRPEDGPS